MQHVFYLLLRRLRLPIITIISVYALSIAGFVIIPGQDDQGNVWHMDFFHAFYFVSFMGSTIGFGEIPYPFTVAQRVWATLTLYATVISWLYSIGTIFSLFQNQNFQRLTRRTRFIRQVKSINKPFYLICGFGVTGSRIAHQLDALGTPSVVIESKLKTINELETDQLGITTPSLCADAADPEVLKIAGIENDLCIGVLALTIDDHTNLAIAINSKLVKPERLVISGSQSKATSANLASFGTDMIIDPFETFADHLTLILQQPYKHLIYDIFVNPHHKVWTSPYQNTNGRWVICGYGRFGKALEQQFNQHKIPHAFISNAPASCGAPEGTVAGIGTEAETLLQADIGNAIGIIAGTDDDADNLSIIITARHLNPNLITVARQNRLTNKRVFRAAEVNLIMEPGRIVANEIYMHVRTPLLSECFNLIRQQDEALARHILLEMSQAMGDQELDAWTLTINAEQSPGLSSALDEGQHITLDLLSKDPRDRDEPLPVFALMFKRDYEYYLAPPPETVLRKGDQILYCGQHHAQAYMGWTLRDHNTLRYIKTGKMGPDGLLWRKLKRRSLKKKYPIPDDVV